MPKTHLRFKERFSNTTRDGNRPAEGPGHIRFDSDSAALVASFLFVPLFTEAETMLQAELREVSESTREACRVGRRSRRLLEMSQGSRATRNVS